MICDIPDIMYVDVAAGKDTLQSKEPAGRKQFKLRELALGGE